MRLPWRHKPVDQVFFEPANPDYWEVTCRGPYSGRDLLVAVAEVLPPGLILYIEGISIAPIVAAYFERRRVEQPLPVRKGVIWPRPKAYHMPMTAENVAGLAELMQNLAEPEVADHVHAYKASTAYLIWYDAWFDSPLYLRKDVSEDAVRRLCADLGCKYSAPGS